MEVESWKDFTTFFLWMSVWEDLEPTLVEDSLEYWLRLPPETKIDWPCQVPQPNQKKTLVSKPSRKSIRQEDDDDFENSPEETTQREVRSKRRHRTRRELPK